MTSTSTKTQCFRHLKVSAMLLCGLMVYGPVMAEMSDVKLRVLGSGGPELSDQRASTSYLLSLDGKARVLLDTGPGSSLRFESSGTDFNDIDVLLYSHLHVDHSADLPAYVKGSYFSGRTRDLPIYGPGGNRMMPSTSDFVEGLFGKRGIYRYLQEYLVPGMAAAYKLKAIDVIPNGDEPYRIAVAPDIKVSAVKVPHGPIPALAWRIEADGCVLTFAGDTSLPGAALTKLARGSDLLIAHYAIPEHAGKVAASLHMPPTLIGKLAADAAVKQLLLSHRMQRTRNSEKETLSMIRKTYSGPVEFAEDGALYQPCR